MAWLVEYLTVAVYLATEVAFKDIRVSNAECRMRKLQNTNGTITVTSNVQHLHCACFALFAALLFFSKKGRKKRE